MKKYRIIRYFKCNPNRSIASFIDDYRHLTSQFITFLLIVLPMVIVLNSCTEKMDINLGTTYTRLAVTGVITTQKGEQYIRLTKTSDYFANQPPPEVIGAVVTVDDGNLQVQFAEDSTMPGYYHAPQNYIGIPGVTYNLSIKLATPINGSTDYEAHETMPAFVDNIDSVVIELNPNFDSWMVRLYAWEPPTTNFYMFNGMRNGEIITDSISRVNISDDKLYNGNYTAGAVVLMLNKDELQPGDTFTLILSNITEDYANYMFDLQAEIRPKDPMFSGPPANVSTNISNDAVGYFAVFPSAFSSTIVKVPK